MLLAVAVVVFTVDVGSVDHNIVVAVAFADAAFVVAVAIGCCCPCCQ